MPAPKQGQSTEAAGISAPHVQSVIPDCSKRAEGSPKAKIVSNLFRGAIPQVLQSLITKTATTLLPPTSYMATVAILQEPLKTSAAVHLVGLDLKDSVGTLCTLLSPMRMTKETLP